MALHNDSITSAEQSFSIDLADKVCLVTGAGLGIGRETAIQLALAGCHVCFCDISARYAEEALSDLNALKPGCSAWAAIADVADPQAVDFMMADLTRRHGRLDVLVHCAAIQEEHEFFDITPDGWRRIIDVNLTGTLIVCQAAARLMREQFDGIKSAGKIINLTSIHDQMPRKNKYAYDASKAGISALTREMALALADWRINVNAIAPGVIDTPMNQVLRDDPRAMASAVARVPHGRAGSPSDVARLALFLASAAADYITGAIIPVDGGRSLFSGIVQTSF